MILIVDDKPENIFSLKSLLEIHGFPVDTAESGEDALRKILNTTYSLIILDVQMPGMDGFEVAEALSGYSKAKDIPIIFLSAVNTSKKFIAKGYTSGGVDYITKPVDPDIFILKVRTLHRLYEQNRELTRIQEDLRQEVEIRRQAEQEITRSMQELRSLIESLPQVAFTASPEGTIEYVNQLWYQYSDKLQQLPEIHPADTAFLKHWEETLLKGEPLIAEIRIKNRLSNEYRFHLLKMIPVKQEGAVIRWVGILTDIQEQKAATESLEARVQERTKELLDKNKELEASNYELQQFASVASHDLKEPLRKIQIFGSILKQKHLTNSEEAHSTADRIIESSRRMSVLINDLLNYSRLSMNSFFEYVNLNTVIHDILNDLELPIQEKQAIIKVETLPEIEAIPGQMRQVFQNLISNSLKFTRSGVRPEITIRGERIAENSLKAETAEDGNYCRISVSDNGIGFNEKYISKIFTIFQRLNAKEAFEGTGIGLAIAKKIVDKHSGLITARSKEDEGTTFILILPLQQLDQSVKA